MFLFSKPKTDGIKKTVLHKDTQNTKKKVMQIYQAKKRFLNVQTGKCNFWIKKIN